MKRRLLKKFDFSKTKYSLKKKLSFQLEELKKNNLHQEVIQEVREFEEEDH